MDMFLEFVQKNLPDIILGAFTIISYTLYFINNHKVGKTGLLLSTLFKEKTTYIEKTDKQLKADNEKRIAEVVAKYEETIQKCNKAQEEVIVKYENAIQACDAIRAEYEQRLSMLEKAVNFLVEEETNEGN